MRMEGVLALIVVALIFSTVFIWKAGVWSECRDEGRSVAYCLWLVSR